MVKKLTKTQVAKEQKQFFALLKKMPKISSRSTPAQFGKLLDFFIFYPEIEKQAKLLERQTEKFLVDTGYYDQFNLKPTLSARGWHKDHNNYNKAEKWELPPSLRRTPARNVTKTGAKRKRATTITKYKR
jgi:hypothetical protein